MDVDLLIQTLVECKQQVFSQMVEGNGRQPAEVVDHLAWMLQVVCPGISSRLCDEVINFYPDYGG